MDQVAAVLPPSRRSTSGWAGASLGVVALLAVAALGGPVPVALVVAVVQVLLVRAVLVLVEAPGNHGAVVVALGAALASDVLAVLDDGRLGGLAGIAGLSLVAALLHQLIRRDRAQVTESLADTLLAVVVVQALACLPALRAAPHGRELTLLVLAAAGAAVLVGRLADLAVPRLAVVAGSSRTWLGLLLPFAAAPGAGAALAGTHDGAVSALGGALVGLAVAAALGTGDLAVELGGVEIRTGAALPPGAAVPESAAPAADAALPTEPVAPERRTALQRVAVVLPYALLAPVALLVGRLVLP